MSITPAQLCKLLEALPEPARLCDDSGAPVAENQAAQDLDWSAVDAVPAKGGVASRRRATAPGDSGVLRLHDLGEGWRLATLESFQRDQNSPALARAGRRRKTDLESLLSGLSHELRNPLSAVLTAANLVQSLPGMDEETVMLLDVIRKESLRMNRILIEFSNYIKMPAPRPGPVDLMELVRSVVEELRRDGVLSADIEIDDKLQEKCVVEGDESQLRNAVSRVVQNAGEAINDSGTLTLSSRASDDSLILCIADSGPGFTTEALHRAFEPFYSGKSQAIGLGLSVALLAIEANGGSIWIAGDGSAEAEQIAAPLQVPLGGACICIRLPRCGIKSM